MTDKEKLVELIKQSADYAINACNNYARCADCPYDGLYKTDCHAAFRADYLIANGVVMQKQGEWKIYKPDCRGYATGFICSNCNHTTYVDYAMKECDYEFCPNCGAKMVKEDK